MIEGEGGWGRGAHLDDLGEGQHAARCLQGEGGVWEETRERGPSSKEDGEEGGGKAASCALTREVHLRQACLALTRQSPLPTTPLPPHRTCSALTRVSRLPPGQNSRSTVMSVASGPRRRTSLPSTCRRRETSGVPPWKQRVHALPRPTLTMLGCEMRVMSATSFVSCATVSLPPANCDGEGGGVGTATQDIVAHYTCHLLQHELFWDGAAEVSSRDCRRRQVHDGKSACTSIRQPWVVRMQACAESGSRTFCEQGLDVELLAANVYLLTNELQCRVARHGTLRNRRRLRHGLVSELGGTSSDLGSLCCCPRCNSSSHTLRLLFKCIPLRHAERLGGGHRRRAHTLQVGEWDTNDSARRLRVQISRCQWAVGKPCPSYCTEAQSLFAVHKHETLPQPGHQEQSQSSAGSHAHPHHSSGAPGPAEAASALSSSTRASPSRQPNSVKTSIQPSRSASSIARNSHRCRGGGRGRGGAQEQRKLELAMHSPLPPLGTPSTPPSMRASARERRRRATRRLSP